MSAKDVNPDLAHSHLLSENKHSTFVLTGKMNGFIGSGVGVGLFINLYWTISKIICVSATHILMHFCQRFNTAMRAALFNALLHKTETTDRLFAGSLPFYAC